MSLRVAVLSTHTCPLAPLGGWETGGMNVYVRELSRALASRGVEIDVFTRRQSVVAAIRDNGQRSTEHDDSHSFRFGLNPGSAGCKRELNAGVRPEHDSSH